MLKFCFLLFNQLEEKKKKKEEELKSRIPYIKEEKIMGQSNVSFYIFLFFSIMPEVPVLLTVGSTLSTLGPGNESATENHML